MKVIAICGFPQAGKSTVQGILTQLGVTPRDDKAALRELACETYGLTLEQTTTQAGKAQTIYRSEFGDHVTVRQAIGELGEIYERRHGKNYWINVALGRLIDEKISSPVSFGSIRMDQGRSIRRVGGVVVGINNPTVPVPTQPYDQFEGQLVDVWVNNKGSLDDLHHTVGEGLWGFISRKLAL